MRKHAYNEESEAAQHQRAFTQLVADAAKAGELFSPDELEQHAKKLQRCNFWRPGDPLDEKGREFRKWQPGEPDEPI